MRTLDIPISSTTGNREVFKVTVRVTGLRWWKFRMHGAIFLLRLACAVAPVGASIEVVKR